MRAYSLLAAAVAIAPVRGHGGLYNYTIDGVDYPGHFPWFPEEGQESVQRRWWPDPIYQVTHPFLACNRGNPVATGLPKLHAPARAGSNVTAYWKSPECPIDPPAPYPTAAPRPEHGDYEPAMACLGPAYQWVHFLGPIFVYLADCRGPCDAWGGSGRRWFKIWETGYSRTGRPETALPTGEEEADLTVNNGRAWRQWELIRGGFDITIPKDLAPGRYLIRHEVWNLEASWQSFPACAQLEVSGDGDKVPGDEYLVEFPGAYKEDDPGVWLGGKVWYADYGHKWKRSKSDKIDRTASLYSYDEWDMGWHVF
ncbi:hypothetical protein DL766_002785 [Monosporascus sp. MC13-8B]|nr:hypothetical protein DL766_002785 [Monosporascus sp. MC13-8B]